MTIEKVKQNKGVPGIDCARGGRSQRQYIEI